MITPLQLVLAGVAVVLVVGIVLYNMYQERRFRKEADRMFSHHREDILLGDAVRRENREAAGQAASPSISLDDPTAIAGQLDPAARAAAASQQKSMALSHQGSRLDPSDGDDDGGDALDSLAEAPAFLVENAADAPFSYASEMPAAEKADIQAEADFEPGYARVAAAGTELDPETEFVARIRFASPSSASFAALLATLNRIGKPVRAFGRRLDGSLETLEGSTRASFDSVEIGMQLADRSGPVSHDQIDAFCRSLYGFSAEEGGAVSCPDKQDALRAARTLDQLCMEVDVLIGLNVIAPDSRPFSCEAIHRQAEANGLSLDRDGGYHARDIEGHNLFSLVDKDSQPFKADCRGFSVRGITLLFDVPRVADGLAVFDRMTRCGFALAETLEGRLVDDNGRPVTEDTLNRDRARLAAFYGRMDARSIPAGGERALRLFA